MVSIVPMTLEHTLQVELIGAECFSVPWSLQSIIAELENKFSITFVAVDGSNVLGFVNVHCVLGEGYINNIAVKCGNRNEGIGSMLLEKLFAYGNFHNIEFFTLEVRCSNNIAIDFYRKHKFIMVGERKNFYEKPTENAILLTRNLK